MTWKNKELKTTTHYLILTNQSITKLLLQQPLNSKGGLLILIKKQHLFFQGTIIIPYLSSALREKSQWKFPHEFNPQNFLNKGEFVKPDAFMPFSAGMFYICFIKRCV